MTLCTQYLSHGPELHAFELWCSCSGGIWAGTHCTPRLAVGWVPLHPSRCSLLLAARLKAPGARSWVCSSAPQSLVEKFTPPLETQASVIKQIIFSRSLSKPSLTEKSPPAKKKIKSPALSKQSWCLLHDPG